MWGGDADFTSLILNILWKRNNLVSLRPNYFFFIGYLKMGDREGGSSEPPKHPLDPPLNYDSIKHNNLNRHCKISNMYLCKYMSCAMGKCVFGVNFVILGFSASCKVQFITNRHVFI